jgi:NADH:ubiquinone oxidoreductase subunit 5 (subunit L)/multisubunit Na+/H+ antiporter MnhA subunit
MNITPVNVVLWALCPLFVGVALQILLARLLSSRGKGILAVLCCVPSLAAVIAAFPMISGGTPLDIRLMPWDGLFAVAFRVDALSLLFASMGTGLGAIVLLYSVGYMAEEKAATRFYAIMLTFIGGFVGLVYFSNIFLLYLCWELVGLCSFSLVGFWYKDNAAVKGARKVLLITHLAGYGLLAALITIYVKTGSTVWTDPAFSGAFTKGIFILMLISLTAKSVQFPLHTWIPDAMQAPTPVSALLHSACYVTAGVYLAARMHSFGPWAPSWSAMMMWIGTVTMAVGVLYALVSKDLKRTLAFSTVSQIGYMITGIGIGTPLAITAGLLHCLNHGYFKGGLFLGAGSVQHAAGTRDLNKLGGLSTKMPTTTAVWMLNVGSMMGIPLLSGFVSKWMLFTAALQAGQIVPALVAWVVSIGTVFTFVKVTSNVFFGNTTPATEHAHESPLSVQWGMILTAAGSVILGVCPQLAIKYIINPVMSTMVDSTTMTTMTSAVQVSWFGITDATGSWWTTGGLVLAQASAVVGGIVYMIMSPGRSMVVSGGGGAAALLGTGGGGVFTGGEPLASDGHMQADDFSLVLEKQWAPFYKISDVDGLYAGIWEWLKGVSQVLGSFAALENQAIGWIVAISAALFGYVFWLAPHAVASTAEGAAVGIAPLTAVSCAISFVALILAAVASPTWRKLTPLMTVSGALAVGAMFAPSAGLRLGLLELATLGAVLLVWQCSKTKKSAWTFLVVALISAASLIAGHFAIESGNADMARALLVTGFFLKLAIVPLFFWLPKIAEDLPALAIGLIISVVDIAAFAELQSVVQTNPWLLTPHKLWLGLAITSALLCSFLMLAQTNLKRLLALSTIEDIGFLVLGVTAASTIGMEGAMFGAAVHALAKALLFISLSTPDAAGELDSPAVGLATRYPLSAAGFLFGMLAMLGIPPTMGFMGRWRLYGAAAQSGRLLLAAFVLASMLSLIAYVRALTKYWWGPADNDTATVKEPFVVGAVMIGLILVLLLGGICPTVLPALIRGIR